MLQLPAHRARRESVFILIPIFRPLLGHLVPPVSFVRPRRLWLRDGLGSGWELFLLGCWAMALTLTSVGDSLYSLALWSFFPMMAGPM